MSFAFVNELRKVFINHETPTPDLKGLINDFFISHIRVRQDLKSGSDCD